ncbi:M15 family metallopeptidase [Ruminococcus sp. FC2018]|uniref:M15 family metallopeptidase n=1 Tax=Ruminococcus sp. FC2018 TaxID=1410617 RepID=UPI000688FD6B|nr:M15 family metallopeptidase [Ruminococcus sp. FC2018]
MIDDSKITQIEDHGENGVSHAEDSQVRVTNKTAHKTFLQRNKYRIRQICGVAILLIVITSVAVLITKNSGSDIESGDSEAQAFIQNTESDTEVTTSAVSTTTSASQSSTTSSATVTEDTTTSSQQTTQETTTQQTTTTEVNTQKPMTSTTTKVVDNKDPEVVKPTVIKGILVVNKSYPLPADYNPGGLTPETAAAFEKMRQAAALDGIQLWICSGFRSYYTQQNLFAQYCWRDGTEKAETYSARPGHSEHQTGLAIDVNYASSWQFDNTPEAKWLAEHCNDYGFIIRYKPGKEQYTGYVAESWHIRYLGDVELCKTIEASGLCLEEYLGISSKYNN